MRIENDKSILVVGAGGLGVPAAIAIARTEIRRIGLVDPEAVELSNLHRQTIYAASDIGQLKVKAAAAHLRAMNHSLKIDEYPYAFDTNTARDLVTRYDCVIDATDSPAAKFLINDTCLAAHRPFVYGGVLGMSGQAMAVLPRRTACLRCLFEDAPDEAEIANCREAGIIGPIAGAIGELQAHAAIEFCSGITPGIAGGVLSYDGAALRVRIAAVKPRPRCICGAGEVTAESQAARN